MDDGEPVKEPEQAVHERRQVGVRLELLHVLGLVDPPERRPAYIRTIRKRASDSCPSNHLSYMYTYRLDERRRSGLTQGRGKGRRR